MNGTDWNEFSSLEDLNKDFNKYLQSKYNNSFHSGINNSPKDRFMKDVSNLKFIPEEELEKHFLHRITRKVNSDSTVSIDKVLYEVPQKYIKQKINIRYSPINPDSVFIFDENNLPLERVYPVKKVDNSKIKRNTIDYTNINGGVSNV